MDFILIWLISSTVVLPVGELAESTRDTSVGGPVTCNGPWLIPTMNGTCQCGDPVHDVVLCSQQTEQVLHCYCMTPDSLSNQTVVGSCLFTCALRPTYKSAPTDCSYMNRKGTLCGDCDKENHSFPRAYSYDIDCMKCSHPESWWRYIAEALAPLTVFIAIVIVCRVSVVSPKLRVFVFISQLVASPINIRPLLLTTKKISPSSIHTSIRIYLTIFGIWNLDFFRTLYPGVCLHLTELQILALDYLVALYPMVLMVIMYVIFDLGYRCRPWLMFRQLNNVLGRFRRQCNIQTTVIDTLVTFFILSTTKFFSVSFDLLTPTTLHVASGKFPNGRFRLYYNANVVYMGQQHLPFAILAFGCFAFFVILPLSVLTLSSSSRFQHSLTRSDSYRRRALRSFLSSFTQYYKDGTNGSRDCRWYASLYIWAFLALHLSFAFTQSGFAYYICLILTILFAILVLLVEPYKEEYTVYNKLDCVLFLWLALFCNSVIFLDMVEGVPSFFVKTVFLYSFIVNSAPLAYIVIVTLLWMWGMCWRRCLSSRCTCFKAKAEDSLPHRITCSSEYRV